MSTILVTFALVGAGANVALPRVRDIRARTMAAEIVEEIARIEKAARDAADHQGRWPDSGKLGVEPAGLARDLSGLVEWSRNGVQYRWENRLSNTVAPTDGAGLGIHVRTGNWRLVEEITRIWEGPLWTNPRIGLTVIIAPWPGNTTESPRALGTRPRSLDHETGQLAPNKESNDDRAPDDRSADPSRTGRT